MSKKIDFEKLQVGTKKQVKKTEILPEEKLDAALKTIHELDEKGKAEAPIQKEPVQKQSKIKTEKSTEEKSTWTKRNCVDMPRDIFLRAKTQAFDKQKPMYQFILDCVVDYLDRKDLETLQNHESKEI